MILKLSLKPPSSIWVRSQKRQTGDLGATHAMGIKFKKMCLWGGALGFAIGMVLGFTMAFFLPGLAALPAAFTSILQIHTEFAVLIGRLWSQTVCSVFSTLVCIEFWSLIVMGIAWLLATAIIFGGIGTLLGMAGAGLYQLFR
jgi:hypothetical protein